MTILLGSQSFRRRVLLGTSIFSFAILGAQAVEQQTVRGHVPRAVAHVHAVSDMAGTNRLHLAIGLPLRNKQLLTNILQELYDPASPQYRHFLTPAQFAEQFGPTAQDYQALIQFATAHNLSVTATHPNRALLDVHGGVADIERMLHLKMRVYTHPTEARNFYAPDSEPALELAIPVLHISGLDNYTTPQPRSLHATPLAQDALPRAGTGQSGSFGGQDFRNAYVPGTTLTGAGQSVGLFELNGYYPSDITAYQSQTGLNSVPLQNVLIDGFNGSAGGRRPGGLNEEVALDIEMALSMAPGLASIIVYEGSPSGTTATIDDILNRMATDNLAKQLSCSWGFDIDENSQQTFLQFAAQGQSFFLASGDSGAFSGPVFQPADNPNVTVVGGTTLTTDDSQTWVSETTWSGSSGGISTTFPIPDWQQGIDMSSNQGSTTMRNIPDVAMIADNVMAVADRGHTLNLSGTSIAAPLWAGFAALINEQAAAQGKPPVGFINPALYRIGKSAAASTAYHDITTGNNATSDSAGLFAAVAGFDLCTGWGTPNGTNLIEALLESPTAGLLVTPPLGFIAEGPVGGSFDVSTLQYTLINAGTSAINWSAAASANWLDVTPSSGTLDPGNAGTTVIVSLNSNATNLLIGSYSTQVTFTDTAAGTSQERTFKLSVGNGDFETGDFTDWTLNGQKSNNFADSVDATVLYGASNLPGVDDSDFVHEGLYGAFLGQNTSLGTLSQTLPTLAGGRYLLSLWLANPAEGTPNEFQVSWNGINLFDQTDLGQMDWTNLQFVVSATTTSTVLEFGFRNDQNAFALDAITVQPLPAPRLLATPKFAENGFTMTWNVLPQVSYQAQYTSDLASGTWTDLGTPVTSTGVALNISDTGTAAAQRFYRLELLP